VEDAVRKFGNVPVLFIAAEPIGACRREWQKRLYDANQSPLKQLIGFLAPVMAKRLRRIGRIPDAVFGFFDSIR